MTNIGRYQILEKLGQGGMGIVYKAFDTLLERVVALKVISAPIEDKPEVRERFIREARAAGQLSHPNIITIHDLGEHEGQPYLAMELLEGEDLLSRMGRPDKMSLRRKVEVAADICYGLEYAHARGLIHRDIKPANIFMTRNGALKILDFGLARLMTSELTGSHMMMGTLNYMAPEQVRGERIDHRVDIFSVGVVFYELLSGRKAFAGDSFASTLFKILNEVPEPLLRIDPTLPPELAAIVDRALAKPRDERYQNMGELLRDLTVFRQMAFADSPMSGRPISDGHRPPSDPWRGSTTPPYGGTPPYTERPPTPAPLLTPPPAPSTAPRWSRGPQLAIVGLIAALAVAGMWLVFGRSTGTTTTSPPASASPVAAADVSANLQRALDAFQRADYTGVERFTAEVLKQAPDHAEARGLREKAREAAATVSRRLQEAQGHFAAGRFEEASRAAGEVLSVAPNHAEAQRIMEEGASRSRGHGAEEARARMIRARTSARAANAPARASGSYRAAAEAERDAQRLYEAGQLAQATARFYEASGLFRSAEIAAQSAATAEAERSRAAEAERTRRTSAPPEPPAPQPAPNPPVNVGAPPITSLPPAVAPAGPPPAPAPSPPPAPAPAPTTSAPTPAPEAASRAAMEDAIRDLLSRYENALETRSLDSLKRLWPSLGGAQQEAIQNEFRHASRIRVEIIEPRIAISGGSATVNFLRRYDLTTVDSQRLSNDTPATMTLRRSDGSWIIESIRFEAPRRGGL
jgi:eukaryotic-like serine/threonine-protein kinase